MTDVNDIHDSTCWECGKSYVKTEDPNSYYCTSCYKIAVQNELNWRKEQPFEPPDEILPKIFLGPENSAIDLSYLQDHKFSHILIVGNHMEPKFPNDIIYHVVDIDDNPDENIAQYFDECFSFIDSRERNILIHCASGISRSGSIVTAYVMKTQSKSYDDALKLVRSRRSVVHPNSGFQKQLREYEKELESS